MKKKLFAFLCAAVMLTSTLSGVFALEAPKSIAEHESVTTTPFAEEKTVADTAYEKYMPKKMSLSLEKSGYADVTTLGIGEIPLEDGPNVGYWLSTKEGNYMEITDWYTDGTPVYCHRFATAENEMVKSYNEGDAIFFNYDLYRDFSNSTGEFTELPESDEGYRLTCYVMGGEIVGNQANMSIIGDWSSSNGGISITYTAPVDDYCFMFIMIIEKAHTLGNGFGAWLNISAVEEDAEFRTAPEGENAVVGERMSTYAGDRDTKLVVAPERSAFTGTYVQTHKIWLEGGKHYVLSIDSDDMIGAHAWFCDENLDVINETYITYTLLEMGYDYSQVSTMIWPTETGLYNIVLGGHWATDEGEVTAIVEEWDAYGAAPLPEVNTTIDISNLTTESESETIGEDVIWEYTWSEEEEMGRLTVGGLPGTYTLTGTNTNMYVEAIVGGIRVVYDNAKTSYFKLYNNVAPVTLEAVGTAKISNAYGYAIVTGAGATGGLYITGDELEVSGVFGIVIENAPVHLAAEKLTVNTTSAEEYLPISIWVCGLRGKKLTLGKNADFDGNNRKTTLFSDRDFLFLYGYGVSEKAELSRISEPSFAEGSLSFVLTTDGFDAGDMPTPPPTDDPTPPPTNDPTPPPTNDPNPTDDPEFTLGDVNDDGNVNTADAVCILRLAAELVSADEIQYDAADVNGDDNVNTADAVMILKYAAGMITEF
ncbi:MAG: dockerin type I repeat-containing protein [Clostridia bacterium]|nr:dockerin type I repeat-containing protein [Clostridia bacterium]